MADAHTMHGVVIENIVDLSTSPHVRFISHLIIPLSRLVTSGYNPPCDEQDDTIFPVDPAMIRIRKQTLRTALSFQACRNQLFRIVENDRNYQIVARHDRRLDYEFTGPNGVTIENETGTQRACAMRASMSLKEIGNGCEVSWSLGIHWVILLYLLGAPCFVIPWTIVCLRGMRMDWNTYGSVARVLSPTFFALVPGMIGLTMYVLIRRIRNVAHRLARPMAEMQRRELG